MTETPYELTPERSEIVVRAIREVCEYRQWRLPAAHIRESHVHVVVDVSSTPEKAIGDFKAYSSRRLNESGMDGVRQKRWAHYGSTVRLSNRRAVEHAVRYVFDEQGAPTCRYIDPDW